MTLQTIGSYVITVAQKGSISEVEAKELFISQPSEADLTY